jgi:hypothetical protein
MKATIAVVLFAALFAGNGAAETLPKSLIEVDGHAYLYSDCVIVTTGLGGKTLHYIVVRADVPELSDVTLCYDTKRPGSPFLSTRTIEVPLTGAGVYLARKADDRLVVDWIAGDVPSSNDRKVIEAYVIEVVKKPPFPSKEK